MLRPEAVRCCYIDPIKVAAALAASKTKSYDVKDQCTEARSFLALRADEDPRWVLE
jgi:hypothetical protein